MADYENQILEVSKKLERIDVLVNRMENRFDTSLEKLTEVSQYVSKLLAVHEEKFDHQQEFNKNIIKLLEERENEVKNDFTEIWKELKIIKEDQKSYHKEINDKFGNFDIKFSKFEKLLWISGISGGVIGFVIGNYDAILKLFH
jgi:chromosome segregation ATPase